MEEIKNTPFLKFFKFFSRRLEKQPGLNVSLRASSLGRGTAPGIQLQESGITLAL